MRHLLLTASASLVLASLATSAKADTFNFGFFGSGTSGNVTLTYGSTHDSKVPQGLAITGISGTVSDANLGITNATITGLQKINPASPEPGNLLAPGDFSHFNVASGLPMGTFLSYDNLFYPGGSPQTATGYPAAGGFLDIYGLLFDIKGGGAVRNEAVNLWSNGSFSPSAPADYGVAFVTPSNAAAYIKGGVSTTPEPATLFLLGSGAIGAFWRRRR